MEWGDVFFYTKCISLDSPPQKDSNHATFIKIGGSIVEIWAEQDSWCHFQGLPNMEVCFRVRCQMLPNIVNHLGLGLLNIVCVGPITYQIRQLSTTPGTPILVIRYFDTQSPSILTQLPLSLLHLLLHHNFFYLLLSSTWLPSQHLIKGLSKSRPF